MCILFLQLNGVKKIAKIMHTSPKKVKIVLSKYGLQVLEAGKWTKVVDHIKEKNFDLSISDYLTQVIIGHILGDASLRIMKKGDLSYPDLDFGEYSIYGDFLKSLQFTDITEITDDLVGKFNKATIFISDYPTAIFRFSQGTIENWFKEEWVDFNSSLFNKEGYINIPTDSSENSNPFYYFDTVPSVQIFDFYAKWYPNNKKTVPFDLEITPDILLYWYLDDGSLGTNSFYIATHSFSEKEVDFLSYLLISNFGLECHTSKTEHGKFNLSISLKKDNLTRFYNYLEKSNPTALALAKKVFPWKFDRYLSFAEVMATR